MVNSTCYDRTEFLKIESKKLYLKKKIKYKKKVMQKTSKERNPNPSYLK